MIKQSFLGFALAATLTSCPHDDAAFFPWAGHVGTYCARTGVTINLTFCGDVGAYAADGWGSPSKATVLLIKDATKYLAIKKEVQDSPQNYPTDGTDPLTFALKSHVIPDFPVSGQQTLLSGKKVQVTVGTNGITIDGVVTKEVFRNEYRVILEIPDLLPSSLK
jgi:hypothetical protein